MVKMYGYILMSISKDNVNGKYLMIRIYINVYWLGWNGSFVVQV
jgi:hypothetical protein